MIILINSGHPSPSEALTIWKFLLNSKTFLYWSKRRFLNSLLTKSHLFNTTINSVLFAIKKSFIYSSPLPGSTLESRTKITISTPFIADLAFLPIFRLEDDEVCELLVYLQKLFVQFLL